MTPETARRILLGGLLMAVPAAAATAGEDPADLPPSLATAMAQLEAIRKLRHRS